MIELYKIVTGKYDTDASINFKFISYQCTQTRGNKYKIFQDHVSYNLRKHFFPNRVIQTWNCLPDSVVASSTINSFYSTTLRIWAACHCSSLLLLKIDIVFTWQINSLSERGICYANSVCLSVCPSVCHTRDLYQNG